MTLGERIKKLRKALDLTQQEFADRIGMKRNSIAQVELGRNTSDQTIVSICREFNVNETWLRTGEGEMFVELPRNEALTAQIQPLLQGGPDKFRERLVSLLLRLPPEHWEVLERYALELVSGSSVPAPVVKSPKEMSDAELHAELDRQLATEREKAEGMSASGRGSSGTVSG